MRGVCVSFLLKGGTRGPGTAMLPAAPSKIGGRVLVYRIHCVYKDLQSWRMQNSHVLVVVVLIAELLNLSIHQ